MGGAEGGVAHLEVTYVGEERGGRPGGSGARRILGSQRLPAKRARSPAAASASSTARAPPLAAAPANARHAIAPTW